MKIIWVRLIAVLSLVSFTLVSVRSNDRQIDAVQRAAAAKIAPLVLEQLTGDRQAEFLIVLADQADLSGASSLKTKKKKARFVYNALWKKAQETQPSMLSWLRSRRIEHRSYYIVNMIWARGPLDVAMSLAARPEVRRIEGNPIIQNEVVQNFQPSQSPAVIDTIEGNITNTRAPEVWMLGFTGQGIVVAGADTGYLWDHTVLKPHYRGFNGSSANHDFNWHDSIHSGGGNCGADSPQPCDDSGHGTHTMGTVVGDDGAGNQTGMAPGARWIGCRNMDRGNGTPATYLECMEFFLAPYPVNGTPAQGNPDLAPDITTNSWTCPPSEGCQPDTLLQGIEAQRAAGIAMVVAAGNSGPSCSTVTDPPAIYDGVYTVGAFDHRTDTIAGFSSRGPVTIDGSNRPKPDISAPGVAVRSAWNSNTTAFNTISGTSMATPHVAGAIALLWSAQPALRGGVAFAEQIINNAAIHVSSTSCGSGGVPNNIYGNGRLDIKLAVDAALPCTTAPTLSATSASFSGVSGTGAVNVNSVTNCGWIGESNATWITITSGASGSGNGTVNYSVAPNPSPDPRTGTMTIGGRTFSVTQNGIAAVGPSFKTDLDADGKSDIGYYRSGVWGWLSSSQLYSFGSPQFFSWGGSGLRPIVADFDGDAKADIGYIVPPSGGQSAAYAILKSSANYSSGQPLFVPAGFPSLGDTPIVGDFDGDGKADPGIWRASQGAWIVPTSSSGYSNFLFSQWGQLGDIPIVGDFDGDGKADIGFYRDGLWGILKSSQSYSYGSPLFLSWGGAGLQPVVGDFDGDGKTDAGYIVPPTGGQSAVYAILKSTTGYSFAPGQPLFVPAGFPSLGDTPVIGDFDADGKADPGIWRASQGVWIIPLSSANYGSFVFAQWGQAGDVPLPKS